MIIKIPDSYHLYSVADTINGHPDIATTTIIGEVSNVSYRPLRAVHGIFNNLYDEMSLPINWYISEHIKFDTRLIYDLFSFYNIIDANEIEYKKEKDELVERLRYVNVTLMHYDQKGVGSHLFLSGTAYLMNDNGKTVEKIIG